MFEWTHTLIKRIGEGKKKQHHSWTNIIEKIITLSMELLIPTSWTMLSKWW